MNNITINIAEEEIVITKKFEKLAKQYGTKAYRQLCEVRNQFPEFKLVIRSITKKSDKESYKGLKYSYMVWYIKKYDKNPCEALKEFEHQIDISLCHKNRYPAIKSWFLDRYPEIVEFGMPKVDETIVALNVSAIEAFQSNMNDDQE